MRSVRDAIAIIKSQEHPRRFVASRLLRMSRIGSRISFQANPEVRLRMYPTPMTETYWMKRAAAYSDDQRFYRSCLKPGDTVVDVGANIGAVTIQAAKLVGPTGQVIAIEAHPRTYAFMLGNIRLNDCTNVTPINSAVGDTRGTVGFSDDPKHDDLNHVVSDGIQVPIDTLDNLIGGGPVDLLKVDVEGYERLVLEGAQHLLRSTKVVYIESFEPQFRRFGYGTQDVVRLLSDAALLSYRRSDGAWVRVGQDYFSERVENLVAVADPAIVRDLAV